MNLGKKRNLAAKALDVGRNRIRFNPENLNEIKEAITKQDVKDLYTEGIITIKPIHGRRKEIKRKTRKGFGKIRRKIRNRKENYIKITRKLRKYLHELRNRDEIKDDVYWSTRRKIKMKYFKSRGHMQEYLIGTKAAQTTAHQAKSKKKTESKKRMPTKSKETKK
jgi:large subunit ribosomal protein L19e